MPQYLLRPDGARLAYRHRPGAGPTMMFLPGYMSDMTGSKAEALDVWAANQGRAMLRLDYGGCGASDGAFDAQTLTGWRDDVLHILDSQTTGPTVLVGSSMGGWLMVMVALARPERVTGLVGIAAAPDFTEWGFTGAQKAELQASGRLEEPSDYADTPYVTTLDFWQSGQDNLLLDGEIAVDVPVRLLHGQMDTDVPFEISLRTAAALRSSDVQVTLVKDGDHRLSRPQDIELILRTVGGLLEDQYS